MSEEVVKCTKELTTALDLYLDDIREANKQADFRRIQMKEERT